MRRFKIYTERPWDYVIQFGEKISKDASPKCGRKFSLSSVDLE